MPGSETTIDYRDDRDVDVAQLEVLCRAAGWAHLDRDVLTEQIRGSRWVSSAWDGPRLIGFARAISDGVRNAYVCTVVVDAAYQGKGVGREVVARLMAGRDTVRWVLHAQLEVHEFYAKLGFGPAPNMLWRDRR